MKIRSILKYVSLFAFTFATQLHATYPDQEQYKEIYDSLRQSDHSWAKRFVDIYDQINKGNKEDLKNLTDKIEEVLDGKEPESISLKVIEKLEKDKALSIDLKTMLVGEDKKASDHWPLFTGLGKMIGTPQFTGMYEDAIARINHDSDILFDVNRKGLFGNQFPVLKTIGLHALLTLRGLNTLSGDDAEDIRSILNIYSPNVIFDDAPNSKKIAQDISLSDTSSNGIVTLWKPSATYEFGGNDASHLIWDCSSLEAFITDCPWRFSTLHQEMAWRHQMGEINLNTMATDISENMWHEFNDKFQAVYADEELKEMDIIVQRKYRFSDNVSCSGHTGFFVGNDPVNVNNILLAESNRFDDKSYEGIGIRSVPLHRESDEDFYWRTFVLRQK
ncbi:MAG: hypothetical protein Q8S31_07915 [Alphaproteobacteria bacterium]|nr:hypothetical protein [Alphaproteobacteria bacterium]